MQWRWSIRQSLATTDLKWFVIRYLVQVAATKLNSGHFQDMKVKSQMKMFTSDSQFYCCKQMFHKSPQWLCS